jgi:hypothetical protein
MNVLEDKLVVLEALSDIKDDKLNRRLMLLRSRPQFAPWQRGCGRGIL